MANGKPGRPQKSPEDLAFKQSVSFTPEQYAEVIDYCQRNERSISWVIRRALKEFLVRHKNDSLDDV